METKDLWKFHDWLMLIKVNSPPMMPRIMLKVFGREIPKENDQDIMMKPMPMKMMPSPRSQKIWRAE